MIAYGDRRRRARLVARHHLGGDATSVEAAVDGVLVLHATDPATVYLSVLARCRGATLAQVSEALYEHRTLVRLLAMRRTLFVVPQALVPAVHAGAALAVADRIRRRLLSELARLPTEPKLSDDPVQLAAWLHEVEEGTAEAMDRLGVATGAQLSAAEPRLRTALLPTTDKAWDVKQAITSRVLTMMGAEGRIVRDQPRGEWRSRHHTWRSARDFWPDGVPELSPAEGRARLAEAYLARFGPATADDLEWWAGWTKGQTRAALAAIAVEEVSLDADQGVGYVLAGDTVDDDAPTAAVALLPALDPTPMGWKGRAWFQPADPGPLYDRFGNIGPTIWWRGEIVGGWAVRPDGQVATQLLLDRGAEVASAVTEEAGRLTDRLDGAGVVPSFPTPLEKELRRA